VALDWLGKVIESFAVGAVGGMAAYWLAQKRFVRERTWERRYEICGEIFDILNQLEHSLLILENAVRSDRECRQGPESREAAKNYNHGLLKLNQLQERLMLLGADEMHTSLMVVYAGLRAFYPNAVIEPANLSKEESRELSSLIRSCRREASGRNGEIAFLARRDLGMNRGRIVRWWRRRVTAASFRRWVESNGECGDNVSECLARCRQSTEATEKGKDAPSDNSVVRGRDT